MCIRDRHRTAILEDYTAAQKTNTGYNAAPDTEHLIRTIEHWKQCKETCPHANQNIDTDACRMAGELPLQSNQKDKHQGEGDS